MGISDNHSAFDPGATLLIVGLTLLAILLWHTRRQIGAQVRALVRSNLTIEQQNGTLRSHAAELEAQTVQLQHQATELEAQRAHLELTLEELQRSERRQHELAEEGRRLNRRLMEGQHVAQLGYWEIDQSSGEVFWSNEMYEFCGVEPGTVPPPTDRYLERVHADDRARMTQVAADAVANRREFTEQYRLMRPDGGTRTVQAKGRLVADADGVTKLIGTVQDVTDRVMLEQQLRQSQKMEAVGRLAGGVAHDVNNMLTVVGGYAQLIAAAREGDDVVQPFVREIVGAIDRTTNITRQLLAFSRSRLIEPRIIDLNHVIREVEPMLGRLIGEDVVLAMRLETGTLNILADPTQITQVLMNLAVNARDAMPAGGRLTIDTATITLDASYVSQHSAVRPGRYAVISVADNGLGMSSETQARIFEPFFTTKPEGRGTGLGLSTVFGIVQQMAGTIWVYSEPDKGTTFKIYFPLDVRPDDARVAANPGSALLGRQQGAKVLVVEDDVALRRLTTRLLQRGHYSVVEAANGEEALAVLETTAVDVVLTDTVMPRMGGRELAKRLAEAHPQLPVVLTSGYTADMLEPLGAVPERLVFLDKPFTFDTLDKAIQDALSGRVASL
ncbi:MAG: ATP-binding protein [Gemmatimonadota bacterium]